MVEEVPILNPSKDMICIVPPPPPTCRFFYGPPRGAEDPDIQRHTIENFLRLYQMADNFTTSDAGEGMIVDPESHPGVWYCDGKEFIRSKGENSNFLPHEAWAMVEKYGISFFAKTDSDWVLLPKGSSVDARNAPEFEDFEHTYETVFTTKSHEEWGVAICKDFYQCLPDQRLLVNGKAYKACLCKFY